jgi:hypothetical protein
MKQRGALARAVATASGLALVLALSLAHAETSHRVLLLTGSSSMTSSSDSELFTRLHAELSAAGFEVVVLATTTEEPPKSLVENAGRELNPAAVVLVRERFAPELNGSVAELWVSDRIGHRTLMQSMMLDAREHSRDMSLLAVQAAELVKARLAALALPDRANKEEALEKPEPSVTPKSEPEPPKEPAPEPVSPTSLLITLSAGVGLLQDLSGLGTTWAPIGRFGVYFPNLGEFAPGIELRLNGAATVTRLSISSNGPGSARASQAFATLDARLHFAPRSSWHPVLTLGSGVFTVGVAGVAPSPYPTHEGRTWSLLSTAGVGLWAQATQGLSWVLDAQVLAAWEPTRVLIEGDRVGRLGAPTLFFSTGVVGIL